MAGAAGGIAQIYYSLWLGGDRKGALGLVKIFGRIGGDHGENCHQHLRYCCLARNASLGGGHDSQGGSAPTNTYPSQLDWLLFGWRGWWRLGRRDAELHAE